MDERSVQVNDMRPRLGYENGMMTRNRVAIVVALMAGPVWAQADPATLMLGRDLYRSLAPGGSTDAAAGYLRDAIREAGGACAFVTAFQLFAQGPGTRTAKVRCNDGPLKLLTVDTAGHVLLAGDAAIAPLDPADGAIVEIAPIFSPEDQASSHRRWLDDLEALFRAHGWPWLPVLLVGALGLWFGSKRIMRKQASPFESARWRGLTSADKDRLIEESREVYPGIYAHPDGVFIARGKRGKRRLFRWMALAYLYRNRGWKIGQI